MAEAHIVAHSGCCITPQSLRLLNHAFVCSEGVSFDNAYGTSSLQVTAGSTGGLTVDVAAGSAFIEGVNFAGEGMYFVSNDSTVSLVLDPADAADPRCDLVVAQVDGNATDCSEAWVLTTVTGVPAPDPACPDTPPGALVLASVLVPAGATTIVAADITNLRVAYQSCGSTPAARLTRSASFPLPQNTWTSIPFTDELFDTDDMHRPGQARITFNTAGFYMVGMSVEVQFSNDYTRVGTSVVLNGTTRITHTGTPGSGLNESQRFESSTMREFQVGDYIEAQVNQYNAALVTRNLNVASEFSPIFYAARIG